MKLELRQLHIRLILEFVLPGLLAAFGLWYCVNFYRPYSGWVFLVVIDLVVFFTAWLLCDKAILKEQISSHSAIAFVVAIVTWELIMFWLVARDPDFHLGDMPSLMEHLVYSIPLAFWSMSWFRLLHYNRFRRKTACHP